MVIKEQRHKSNCLIIKNTSNCKTIVNAVHKGTWYNFIKAVKGYAKSEFDDRFDCMGRIRSRSWYKFKQRQFLAAKSREFYNAVKSVLPLLRQDATIYEGEKRVHYLIAKLIVENYSMRGITILHRDKIALFHDGGPDTWQ